jgi:hypothetical protein
VVCLVGLCIAERAPELGSSRSILFARASRELKGTSC